MSRQSTSQHQTNSHKVDRSEVDLKVQDICQGCASPARCCLWKFSPDRWLPAETWISQKFPPSVLGLSGSPSWLLPAIKSASTPMRLILAAWQLIRWPSLGDRPWQHTLYLSEIITNVSWWLLRIVCKRQLKPKECNCRTRTRSSVDDAGCSALQGVRPSCPLMRIPLAPCRPLSHCQLGSKPTRSESAAKTAYKGGKCEMGKCCKIQDQWIDETRSGQTLQPYGLRKQRRFTMKLFQSIVSGKDYEKWVGYCRKVRYFVRDKGRQKVK